MTELTRTGVIELLERLGAEDDATVLEAARTLHRDITAAGVTWDDLLRPGPGADDDEQGYGQDDYEDDYQDEEEDELDPQDEDADEEEEDEEDAAPPPGELAEDAELINKLLARKDLARDTREELKELKRDIAAGDYEAMDSRYVRALAKRLGV